LTRYTEIGTNERHLGTENVPSGVPETSKEEEFTVVICADCGKKNVGHLYCERCGSDLYARNRRPERSLVSIFDRPLVIK